MGEITLSRERILGAAIQLVDRDGLAGLNMRRLAAELGVGTMSLYHYVTDKEALLEGIAEVVMNNLEQPAGDLTWTEAVTRLSMSFRRIALDHPAVFPLLLGRRTPPAVVRAAGQAVMVLRRHGFDDQTSIIMFRVIVRFLIGWCLVETNGGPGAQRALLTREEADEQFSFALSAVLRGSGGLAACFVTAGPFEVEDPNDPRVTDFIALTDAAARSQDLFIAEGTVVIRQLLASAFPIRSVLVTPTRWRDLGDDLSQYDIPVYIASQQVMNAIAGFDIHRGAVASAARLPLIPLDSVLDGSRRLLVVEGVTDHENMGALFRNAAAFGVDAVLLSPDACDPLYRRAIRVSAGQVLRIPFTRVPDWPGGLDRLVGAGFTVVALTPGAAAEPVDAVASEAPGRWALVVGTEGTGLTEGALHAAGRRVRIPMAAGVDSLNVATAAAVALFAFTRDLSPR